MKVSARAEYGIRALIDLARHYGEGPVQSHDIARRQGLPEPYLNQLMAVLRRAGLVHSKRGPSGGHVLARSPESITVGEAFLVLEGSVAPWLCVEDDDPHCIYAPGCGLRPVWQAVKAATWHGRSCQACRRAASRESRWRCAAPFRPISMRA